MDTDELADLIADADPLEAHAHQALIEGAG